MSITARVDGADELAQSTRAAARALDDLDGPLDVVGDQIADTARGLAPVRTGRLRRSITVTPGNNAVTVTAGAPYASFVEARNPFLSDALERRSDDAVNTITNAVEDILDTIEGT